ncbi:hypothetical protein M8818_002220 [Zalaria obscura]|uniref:Uncharacterized protein n=1 Tax=Zalaria obscura TaxID=2024903 RepID=A0ACC3SJA0_9PEZI
MTLATTKPLTCPEAPCSSDTDIIAKKTASKQEVLSPPYLEDPRNGHGPHSSVVIDPLYILANAELWQFAAAGGVAAGV